MDTHVSALAFDVFGTLVDWRSGVAQAGRETGVSADWDAVADDWRREYQPALDRVRRGDVPWCDLDALHRQTLPGVLAGAGITALDATAVERLVQSWHRLPAWPDTVEGLRRLHTRYTLATLSNGHTALLEDLVRYADLPIDRILSAAQAATYKPDPAVYRTACELLGRQPADVCMVAAHPGDLAAAHAVGMRTAFVRRPREWGPATPVPEPPDVADVVADDMLDLAARLRS